MLTRWWRLRVACQPSLAVRTVVVMAKLVMAQMAQMALVLVLALTEAMETMVMMAMAAMMVRARVLARRLHCTDPMASDCTLWMRLWLLWTQHKTA